MGNPRDRRRQKKLEKQKKKRDIARKRASGPAPMGMKAMRELARSSPFGPVWIGESVDEESEPPELVTVLVSRQIGGGKLLPELVLVDRTCLGVKNAFVMRPMTEIELNEAVREISESDPLRRCDSSLAQSVVFHALDYARSLGFNPQRDFEPALFEPRPEPLLDTPLSRPERPNFVAGPHDDVPRILKQLEASVGSDGYDFTVADDGGFELPDGVGEYGGDDDDDDAGEEDVADAGVIEAELLAVDGVPVGGDSEQSRDRER
jgi:hypothetical protein